MRKLILSLIVGVTCISFSAAADEKGTGNFYDAFGGSVAISFDHYESVQVASEEPQVVEFNLADGNVLTYYGFDSAAAASYFVELLSQGSYDISVGVDSGATSIRRHGEKKSYALEDFLALHADEVAAHTRNRQLSQGEYEGLSGLFNQILDWTADLGTYADAKTSVRVERGPGFGGIGGGGPDPTDHGPSPWDYCPGPNCPLPLPSGPAR